MNVIFDAWMQDGCRQVEINEPMNHCTFFLLLPSVSRATDANKPKVNHKPNERRKHVTLVI